MLLLFMLSYPSKLTAPVVKEVVMKFPPVFKKKEKENDTHSPAPP